MPYSLAINFIHCSKLWLNTTSKTGALFRFFRNASTEARQADFNAITDKYALKDNDEDFPRVSKIRGDLWRPREKKIYVTCEDTRYVYYLYAMRRRNLMKYIAALKMFAEHASVSLMGGDTYNNCPSRYEGVTTAAFLDPNKHGHLGIPHPKKQPMEFKKLLKNPEFSKERLEREAERMGYNKDFRFDQGDFPIHPYHHDWRGHVNELGGSDLEMEDPRFDPLMDTFG
eukprot:jgi/Bigna1/87713/estExt_fgenesh1_pg.C_230120